MSLVIPGLSSWLATREAADARARSVELAERAGTLARARAGGSGNTLVVHDLGGGTGAMASWLAPRLPGPQAWVLHDWDADLVLGAARDLAVRDADGGAVALDARVGDLADLVADDLAGASLVTASALLDVLALPELIRIVDACVATGAPAYFALSVTGRVSLEPVDAADSVFQTAFDDHQRRTTGGRRLLGPDAVAAAVALFDDRGWQVTTADTPWDLGPADARLVDAWLSGWVDAAVEQRRALQEWAGEVLRRRRTQLARGSLRVTVHHLDLLAWPR
jgi:hypothetical protein